jgi:hypothetical protein
MRQNQAGIIMAYQTTSRLIRKHGQAKVLWIKEALNNDISQRVIAKEFGLSKARMCQICNSVLRPNWDFCEEAKDALRFEVSVKYRQVEELRKVISEDPSTKEHRLRLIVKGVRD